MSEVAALAVFLDWHLKHRAFEKVFPNAQVLIVPIRNGKKIRQLRETILAP
jgi:predicted SpoU family rRNA methylase